MHPLLHYTESQQDWLLETVEALVRAESPSTDKTAVDRCGAELARRLRDIGADVTRSPQTARGDHLVARFAGEGPPILILGHFDTVWSVGQIARMPLLRAGERLHGPGIFDMKAGIATALLALRALDAQRLVRPQTTMLFTTDEEIGSATSRQLIEDTARASAAVLVLEPSLPGGAAKTSRKGVGEFEITVHGVSAHAGIAPAQGANAVHELGHQIVRAQSLQDLGRGLSVNVTAATGGERTNVIPDLARATVDVRVPTMADAAWIDQAMRSLSTVVPGTRLEIAGGVNRPPLERTPAVVRLFELAQGCARELGRELGEGGTGGGSDGNFTAAAGVPTLDGLGPEGDGAHALHEHVLVADLAWRAAFLAVLLTRLGSRAEVR